MDDTGDRDDFAEEYARGSKDPESLPSGTLTWSDEYVRTLWTLIHRRDEQLVKMHADLIAANEAVRELRAMVERSHT